MFHIVQKPPKFCTAVKIMDVITCDKLFSDRLGDVDSVEGR